jgi:hypothetical protein
MPPIFSPGKNRAGAWLLAAQDGQARTAKSRLAAAEKAAEKAAKKAAEAQEIAYM